MTITITPPHPRIREHLLFIGGGGKGKTTAALSIARACPDVHFWVVDNDISHAWTQMILLGYSDIAERGEGEVSELLPAVTIETGESVVIEALTFGNVTILEIGVSWTEFKTAYQYVAAHADQSADWVVVDSVTPTWNFVQNWMSSNVFGEDIAARMVQLKRETAREADPVKAFNAQMSESMNWPQVNKEYDRFYSFLQRWRGHVILTAQAKEISKNDGDDVVKVFGPYGVRPDGQKNLHHVAGTNLIFTADKRNFKLTTAGKDREHARMDSDVYEDFAVDFLVAVHGWGVVDEGERAELAAEVVEVSVARPVSSGAPKKVAKKTPDHTGKEMQ